MPAHRVQACGCLPEWAPSDLSIDSGAMWAGLSGKVDPGRIFMQARLIAHPRAANAIKGLLLTALAFCVLEPVPASAQIVPTWRQEYDKRLKYGS